MYECVSASVCEFTFVGYYMVAILFLRVRGYLNVRERTSKVDVRQFISKYTNRHNIYHGQVWFYPGTRHSFHYGQSFLVLASLEKKEKRNMIKKEFAGSVMECDTE